LYCKDEGIYGWGFGQHGTMGLGADNLKTFPTPQFLSYFNRAHNVVDILYVLVDIEVSFDDC
jgi:hypothetical protein